MSSSLANNVIKWNITFPLDRWWRKKYNVPFGSRQHLEMSPIDILFEFCEEQYIQRIYEQGELEQEKERRLLEGEWISESNSPEQEKEDDELFDSI